MSTPEWVAGVDGCPDGWLVVLRDTSGSAEPLTRIVASFADVLALPEAPHIVAIDMPIGLPEHVTIGGRAPDIAARAVLGKRRSSVSSAIARGCDGHGLPRRVRDRARNVGPAAQDLQADVPAFQSHSRDRHPDDARVAAARLRVPPRGRVLGAEWRDGTRGAEESEISPHGPGLEQRRSCSEVRASRSLSLQARTCLSAAGPDDFLDACACAWSAGRILARTARTFPDAPPHDARGLRQEIKA